jgi:hypothetical protein
MALRITDAQHKTAEILCADLENALHEPVDMQWTEYGSGGRYALLVLSVSGPAPNPVKLLFQGGNAHIVNTVNDYDRWLTLLKKTDSRITAVREEDTCYVVEQGGSFTDYTVQAKGFDVNVDGSTDWRN